jgi:hypothetical protein
MFVSSALSLRSGDRLSVSGAKGQILLGLVEPADDLVDASDVIGYRAPLSVDLGDVYRRWNERAGVDARLLRRCECEGCRHQFVTINAAV